MPTLHRSDRTGQIRSVTINVGWAWHLQKLVEFNFTNEPMPTKPSFPLA
ncbi:MAG: hypothetical protein AB4426_24655 [Xenococcaceae cyanobacterium]